jgi:flavin reductase (DIM6/NTAB) family NADH-FMN oxidoreductase RutF
MDRRSTTWPVLRRADGFTISVLAEDQDEVCLAFAEKDRDRFAGVAWQPGPLGHPRLSGAVSWLDCRIHRIDDAGDHELVLGEVRHLEVHDQPSLVFHAGRFARLEDRDSTAAARLPSSAFTGLHGLDVAAPFFDVLAARINGAAASSPKEGRP